MIATIARVLRAVRALPVSIAAIHDRLRALEGRADDLELAEANRQHREAGRVVSLRDDVRAPERRRPASYVGQLACVDCGADCAPGAAACQYCGGAVEEIDE